MFPFYTPWKHKKNLRFSSVFRGYKMGALAWNGLTVFIKVFSQNFFHKKTPSEMFDRVPNTSGDFSQESFCNSTGLYKLRERLLVEIRDTKYYNERYLFTAKCIASLSYLFNKYRYKIMTFSDSYNAFEVF